MKLKFKPGQRHKVQVGSVKRAMTVVSRSAAFDRKNHCESVRLVDRTGKLRVEISIYF